MREFCRIFIHRLAAISVAVASKTNERGMRSHLEMAAKCTCARH